MQRHCKEGESEGAFIIRKGIAPALDSSGGNKNSQQELNQAEGDEEEETAPIPI